MIKKLIIPLAATALFIAAVGIFIQKSAKISPPADVATPSVTIDNVKTEIEVAKTETEREKGLSGRQSLDSGKGMLFVFGEDSAAPKFWMKDMLIPIDIIWIKDGKIIRIDKNVPIPAKNTPDSKLKTYSAGSFVNYVLEVNAGFSDTNSIKVGDTVTLSGI